MSSPSRDERNPILRVNELRVAYGAIVAVKGISFEVGEGEIVALIGANGAGKSSTLRAISGMLRPHSGRIEFRGEDTTLRPAHELVRRGLAHAPEGRGIFLNLTVEENLDLGAYTRRDVAAVSEDRDFCHRLFPRVKERGKQLAGTLSGGEQQMLAVARALMSRPKLLVLDEPSLGLAPQVAERIFQSLAEVNRAGLSILLVEQNAFAALSLAHHAYVLETGEVAMQGSGRELLSSPKVREAYLGEVAPAAPP